MTSSLPMRRLRPAPQAALPSALLPVLLAIVLAVTALACTAPHERDLDEPPDREAALLLARSLDDPSQPGVALRQYQPLFGLGEATYGSRGNAGLMWVGAAPGRLNVWQYVFRFDSADDAESAYRHKSPEIVHADDGAFKWSVAPGVPGVSAAAQKLVTPDEGPPEDSTVWHFWARYGMYVVEVVVRQGDSGAIPRSQVEALVTQVDRTISASSPAG